MPTPKTEAALVPFSGARLEHPSARRGLGAGPEDSREDPSAFARHSAGRFPRYNMAEPTENRRPAPPRILAFSHPDALETLWKCWPWKSSSRASITRLPRPSQTPLKRQPPLSFPAPLLCFNFSPGAGTIPDNVCIFASFLMTQRGNLSVAEKKKICGRGVLPFSQHGLQEQRSTSRSRRFPRAPVAGAAVSCRGSPAGPALCPPCVSRGFRESIRVAVSQGYFCSSVGGCSADGGVSLPRYLTRGVLQMKADFTYMEADLHAVPENLPLLPPLPPGLWC